MDLYELLDLYRLHRPQLTDSTVGIYRYGIRSFERFLEHVPVATDLQEGIILRFLGRRLGEAAGWTVKREVGSLCLLWRFAWKRKLTPHDPRDADIPAVRINHEPPIALTVAQVESILDSCRFERGTMRGTAIPKALWWRCLVLTLYWSGARIGAVLAAKRSDLDVSSGWLHLRAESAKTGRGQWVQLPLELAAAIPVDGDLLFRWPYGRRQIFAAMKRIAVRAGLPPSREYRFHAFRRTAATLATCQSSLQVAQMALGHSSQSMTLRYVDPRVTSQPLLSVLPKIVG